jgi:hypothetical protein
MWENRGDLVFVDDGNRLDLSAAILADSPIPLERATVRLATAEGAARILFERAFAFDAGQRRDIAIRVPLAEGLTPLKLDLDWGAGSATYPFFALRPSDSASIADLTALANRHRTDAPRPDFSLVPGSARIRAARLDGAHSIFLSAEVRNEGDAGGWVRSISVSAPPPFQSRRLERISIPSVTPGIRFIDSSPTSDEPVWLGPGESVRLTARVEPVTPIEGVEFSLWGPDVSRETTPPPADHWVTLPPIPPFDDAATAAAGE